MSTEAMIRRYILQNLIFSSDENRLRNDASLMEGGIIDSTGILDLVMFVEGSFSVKVEDEDIVPENFDSVKGLARYVEAKRGEVRADAGE